MVTLFCTNLHIVEITQSYRLYQEGADSFASTHSRNYLVIQTPKQAPTSHRHLHIVEITQSYRLKNSSLFVSTIYTQQKLLSHIDSLQRIIAESIYTQQKLLSHIDLPAGPVQPISIYTQQKLLSHIDNTYNNILAALSTHSRNYLVIQTI